MAFGIFSWFPSGRKTVVGSRPRSTTRLAVEGLEARDVPAVVGLTPLTPVLTNGVLTVIGNENANTIEFTKFAGKIQVLGMAFPSSSVKQIVVDGQGGSDTITIAETILQKTTIYGGSGGDTIRGGGGDDVIYGGTGEDFLYGRGGSDTFYGGAGKDRLDGGAGSDFSINTDSNDVLVSTTSGIGEDSTLTAYVSNSYTGQVVNEVLRLVNEARSKAGKNSLKLDVALNTVGSDYAKLLDSLDVVVGQGISHAFSGHNKPLVSSRLEANYISYSTAGENNSYRLNTAGLTSKLLAYQFMYGPDGKGGLMNSAGHKANILNGSFTKLGLGLSGTTATGYYLTQVFTG